MERRTVMEYTVSFIWISIEVFCLYFTCKAFLLPRFNSTQNSVFIPVSVALFFVAKNLIDRTVLAGSIISIVIALFLCLLFSGIAFSGPWYIHVVIAVVYYFSLAAVDTAIVYSMSLLLGITVNDLIWKKWLYSVVVASGKLILLFGSWLLSVIYGKKKTQPISKTKIAIYSVFPFLSILMMYTIFDTYKDETDLSWNAVVFSIILIISNIALIFLFSSLERTNQAEKNLAILNQSMNLQTENIKHLEKSYRDQRTATHEFEHHLMVISNLLENGNTMSAKEYVTKIQAEQATRIFAVNTNHPIVDAILNQKYHIAKENSIDIRYKVNDLSMLNLEANAIVVVLSNLLDNAIEGTMRLPADHRIIECATLLDENFFVSIRNTAPQVEIKDGRIATVKFPKEEHGFGLPGVQRILKQLGGEYAFDYSEPWFQFVAEVPNTTRN